MEELKWPVLISDLNLNTFGMMWNADCAPGLLAQHQCLVPMLLCVNGQIPKVTLHIVVDACETVEIILTAKQGT